MNEEKLKKFLVKWCLPDDETAKEQFDRELNDIFE